MKSSEATPPNPGQARASIRPSTVHAAHKETEHYRRWRETVAEWMAEPRWAALYDGFAPDLEVDHGGG